MLVKSVLAKEDTKLLDDLLLCRGYVAQLCREERTGIKVAYRTHLYDRTATGGGVRGCPPD